MKEFAFIRRAVLIVLLLVLQLPAMSVGAAGTVIVTTLVDTTGACAGSGAGACSLRDAVTYANAHSGTTITFQAGLTGTITLTSGKLPLNTSMTVTGPGAHLLAVDGNNADKVFAINDNGNSGVVVNISGLTIQHGNPGAAASGGGISVFIAALNLSDSAVISNVATQGAGGIHIEAFTGSNSNVTITRSTISGNTTSGIFNEGTLTITNSTISGNTGGFGGIRSADGSVTIANSTIGNNSATNGGGVSIVGGSVSIQSSIFSGNTNNALPADVHGTVTSLGYNLIGNTNSGGGFVSSDLQNVNPLLGPLQSNGGPTATHAIGPTSPARDALPAAGAGCPATDQRGVSRPQGTACDIGASELAMVVYVNAGAAEGGIGTQVSPLQSIGSGIRDVVPGGTVHVAANAGGSPTYHERLTVDRNVMIIGAGAATTIVDGTNGGVVITINSGITATISGLTIQHGKNDGATGGGILNHGALTLTDSVLANNAAGDGGGLYTDGSTVSLVNSAVRGNTSASSGGGIFVNGGTVDIQRSTISGNTLSARGAGIFNDAILTLTNSTVSGNATAGGFGDGIDNDFGGTLTLIHCTVSANNTGGGGDGLINSNGGSATIRDTIIAENTLNNSGPDVTGAVTSQGYNLIGNASAVTGLVASDLPNVNPLLRPLTLNAPGATQTQSLMPGSPAIDAGGTCSGVTSDQRGISRPQGNACDIGAYEYAPVTPTLQPAQAGTGGQMVILFAGTGFQRNSIVTLDGAPLTIAVADDGNALTATVPAHASGTVTIAIVNPGNGHTANGTLTYSTPQVVSSPKPTAGSAGNSNPLPNGRPGLPAGNTAPNPLPPSR